MGTLAILGIISAALGVASAIGAGVKGAQSNKEIKSQQGIINKQHAEQEALFNRQYYQDMTDRTEVMDILRKMDEQENTARKRNQAQATVMGATDEAKLAMEDSLNKSRSETIANLASNASMLKDQYLSDWRNRMDNYYGQQIGMSDKIAGVHKNQSDQWSQAATNAFNTSFKISGAETA